MFKYILDKFLHGGDSKLRGYEISVLKAFMECLDNEKSALFSSQINKLTKVQRWQNGKITAFFDYRDEMKNHWPKELAFFNLQTEEDNVATVMLNIANVKVKVKIEFYKGYLLYLKFSKEMDFLDKSVKKSVCKIKECLNYPGDNNSEVVSKTLTTAIENEKNKSS